MPNFRQIAGGGNRSRITTRIPAITNEHINSFSGANISDESGSLYNCVVDRYAGEEDRLYVTERPSIALFEDASELVTKTKGRGIYYWSKADSGVGKRYFVNDDIVYKDTYNTACTISGGGGTGLTSGTERVYFIEWSSANEDYLFVINPEDNQIFVISDAANTVLINLNDSIAITGTGSPFHASDSWDFTGLPVNNSKTLCHGGVILDSYLFLGNKDGTIYNSNVDNLLKWSALDFLTAERENDQLLLIEKTKDHLVAMGERSTELFYDAGNTTGSPLSPRKDIYYQQGAVSGECAWADGHDIYFVGMKPSGDFALYGLVNFELQELTSSTLSSFLRHSRTEATLSLKLSGISTGGHTYAILTIYNVSNIPIISFIYDNYTKIWYEWETDLLDLSKFAVADWSIRTPETPVTAEGIYSNGDLFFIADDFEPTDTTASTAYFSGQYSSGTYSLSTTEIAENSNITMRVNLTNIELGNSSRKFMHSLQYVGNRPSTSQTLTIEWSDDEGQNWYSDTIDINSRNQINRLGSFERRRFRLTYSGNEQLRLEGLDATYTQGST